MFFPLGKGRIVTSPWGSRSGGFHKGTDFGRAGGSANMPVYAVEDGTVVYAGAADGYGGPDPAGWLVIQGRDRTWEYGHIVRQVKKGDKVVAGQQIAYINPNRQTNAGVDPHLHVSVMPGGYNPNNKVNPMTFLVGASEPGVDPVVVPVVKPTPTVPVKNYALSGRLLWLEEVARAHLGDRLKVMPGWQTRGHGDFKEVRGNMWHHTGNRNADAASIANGRPDLAGPLSNFHIAWDGTVTLIAAGVCWHAGQGSYPWLPTNMGNWYLIGIECSWPTIQRGGGYDENERWPDASIISQRDLAAGLSLAIRKSADCNIDHKEYAGRAQGKWDRGNVSPPWFRGEVKLDMEGKFGDVVTLPPPPVVAPPAGGFAHVLLYRGMSGDDVRALQTRLKRNYSKLVVDGDFGPHTEQCVRDYQSLHGLDSDGVVGPATAASLQLYI